MKLLELLKAMFGQKYLNNIIGTKTNISKPIKLDKNSPFKLYSDSAFENPEVLKFIEKKLAEYGPYALSNKNMSEVKNFEMNARRYLNAKNKTKESQVKKALSEYILKGLFLSSLMGLEIFVLVPMMLLRYF